jgi:hypothetical protein
MIVGDAKCFDLYGGAGINHKWIGNKKASTY